MIQRRDGWVDCIYLNFAEYHTISHYGLLVKMKKHVNITSEMEN